MPYNAIYNDPIRRSNVTDTWVYWDDIFNTEELNGIIEFCSNNDISPGKVFNSDTNGEEVYDKIRTSDVGWYHRTTDTEWIFDRMNMVLQVMNERYYNFDLNGYDSFQYTEYDSLKSGHYDWHMDMHIGQDSNVFGGTRKLSMSILLNDDFKGGEFMFNVSNQDKPLVIPTKPGRAIIFPSWMLHRVAPVTDGKRRSIVVWVVGPKFI